MDVQTVVKRQLDCTCSAAQLWALRTTDPTEIHSHWLLVCLIAVLKHTSIISYNFSLRRKEEKSMLRRLCWISGAVIKTKKKTTTNSACIINATEMKVLHEKKPNNNELQTFKESLLSSVSVQVKIQVHVRWSLLSKRHRLHRRYNSLNEIVGIRLLLPPAPNCNYLMSSWISTLMLCFDMGCFQTVLCLCLCLRLCRLHQLWNVPSLSLCQVFSCGTFCWMSFFFIPHKMNNFNQSQNIFCSNY